MADLSNFPITHRWPATNPGILQLYSFPTPNGVKVSIMLEEIGLPYEAHRVTLAADDVKSPAFLSLNPNGKIPAIIDPDGPNGGPVALFESGAILHYLAEKTGKLLPDGAGLRAETLSWLMFQMGGIGPMFGQLGYFNVFAGKEIEDKRPLQRFVDEGKRLLSVLDERLATRTWLMGDTYTIADIATFPWLRQVDGPYAARDLLEMDRFPNVDRWWRAAAARPASVRGLAIPSRAEAKLSA